ncbi:PaaI family thioesterase [Aliikangiella sp. IMCC44359]|uniref:PaaI family thioesterase n=1 Tax=Aliikangiella sp. IMCC44359 TaxID=3459125 RepID=UPI00403AF955
MNAAEVLLENDPASQMLGIELVDHEKNSCCVSMLVKKNMTNGYDVCHGGFLYTLADTAAAFAASSQGEIILTASNEIIYLKPAMLHDQLIAKAVVTNICGKIIYCDVKILNQEDTLIAVLIAKLVNKSFNKESVAKDSLEHKVPNKG